MSTLDEQSLAIHKKHKGKLGTVSVVPVKTKEDLTVLAQHSSLEPYDPITDYLNLDRVTWI